MEKKLQVFISSTFLDLQEERQAAVQAVLNAGHIPAGMELFKAGDESQQQVIEEWINDSDVYLLILGGRYGALNNEGISYTEWEYNKAAELGKERFSLILNEEYINAKVAQELIKATDLETKNDKYVLFKERVEKKLVKYIDHEARIESAIQSSLRNIEKKKNNKFDGWVRYSELINNNEMKNENNKLKNSLIAMNEENQRLENSLIAMNEENERLENRAVESAKSYMIGEYSYDELYNLLDRKLLIPEIFNQSQFHSFEGVKSNGSISMLSFIQAYLPEINTTVYVNEFSSKNDNKWYLIFKVFPILKMFELVDFNDLDIQYETPFYELSKLGKKFFSKVELEKYKKTTEN